MGTHSQNQSKKAGTSGLFRYGLCSAAFLLVIAHPAGAEPLAIEVISAEVAYGIPTGEPVVSFKMSEASSKAFAKLTLDNVGRKFAIRIDGQTISSPVIREPVLGGAGQISGHFTMQQAHDIAARLSSGASTLELEIEH